MTERTAPLTVFHVSDLHFGRPAVPAQIEAIEALIAERKFDVVAMSGDFTQRARSGEFQRAHAFVRDARKVSAVVFVPGNHDVMWWKKPLRPRPHDAIYANWREYLAPETEPVLRIPGATFVGLNTSQGITPRTLTWNMRDLSVIGDLRPEQVRRAAEEFAKSPAGDAKVIVMHHNPVKGELSQRHGLKNTKRILDAFGDMGVDAVLCGHDHQEAVHLIEHTRKGVIVATAGTVSNRSRGGRPSSVNLLEITPADITVHTYIWSQETSTFAQGPERCFPR